EAAAVGADADIAAPRSDITRRTLAREEIILHIQALRRENVDLAQEKRLHLHIGPANGGRGGDDLGADLLTVYLPGRQVVDGRFVKSHERSQWPRDEVQFVLDNQVGRAQGSMWQRPGAGQLSGSGMRIAVFEVG